MQRFERMIPAGLFVFAATYYYLLSSKIFTWVYTSGDAGDWLALTNWWYVPHQWGKPLVVVYIRFLSLFPGDDVVKLTTGLAIIPGAVTVVFAYLIAKHLTGKVSLGLAAAVVLLGATIFTTQTTVLEQYAFTAMFLVIAFYFQVRQRREATILFLGLATATHIVGLCVTFLWMACTWREWRDWLRVIPIYIIVGIVPYALILAMMADPATPKLVAGGLSWQSINSYLGNTATGVNLALVAAPRRLLQFVQIFVITLGLAYVPLIKGLAKPDKLGRIVIAVSVFVAWFYMTNLFPSVWKWSTLTLPLLSIYVAVGLSKLPSWHFRVVMVGAIALIAANGLFFNAARLAGDDPQATDYVRAVYDLPDNSAVLVPRGGQYGFALFYIVSEGEDIVPLLQGNPWTGMGRATFKLSGDVTDQSYVDYLVWLEQTYGVQGGDMYEIVQYCLDNGYGVYYGQSLSEIWAEVFIFDPVDSDKMFLQRVIGIRPDPGLSQWEG